MVKPSTHWSLYPYSPSAVLPIVFAIIVSLLAFVHFYLSILKYRWYHFGWMVLWASSIWISGFVCRAISVYNTENINIYIAQYTLIIAGPVVFAASEYFVLGRLLSYLPYHTPLHPGRVLSTFLLSSAAVESLTACGASMLINDNNKPSARTIGLTLIKVSLILQTILEACVFSLVALLEYRARRGGQFSRNVRVVCNVLYITSFMMLVRCIFRAVEGFAQSSCPVTHYYWDTVDRYEWFLWIFEVANVTVFTAILAAFTPGKYLPRDIKIYLDPVDGQTERMGPGFANATSRSFIATLLDPFNLVGRLSGRYSDSIDKFWERDHPVVEASERQGASNKRMADPEQIIGKERHHSGGL